MGFQRDMNAMVRVQLVSADPMAALLAFNSMKIVLFDTRLVDDLTIEFMIKSSHLPEVTQIAEKRGDRISFRKGNGFIWAFLALMHRPVLLLGMTVILLLTFYIPSRVLFVEVDGNNCVPARQIIEVAENAGVYFGASRSHLRSEKIKNTLLTHIPQLEWAGINTKGCVARISVKERSQSASPDRAFGISSIVSARDGIITEVTVYSGNPVCKPGKAVQTGDLLVSGYSDCGICIHGTRASAEIYADTAWPVTAFTPLKYLRRDSEQKTRRTYSLLIGKNRLKFCKNSGIYNTGCVRMYKEYYMSLPGGFQLPLALAVDEEVQYSLYDDHHKEAEISTQLTEYTKEYLSTQMIAGKVISGSTELTAFGDYLRLNGRFLCNEMIGRTRPEETVEQYEQTD